MNISDWKENKPSIFGSSLYGSGYVVNTIVNKVHQTRISYIHTLKNKNKKERTGGRNYIGIQFTLTVQYMLLSHVHSEPMAIF